MVIGSQPASGKSTQLDDAKRMLASSGKTWVLSADEFVYLHPNHDKLSEKHGSVTAAELCREEVGHWVKMTLAAAQQRRVNLVLETTFRQPDVVERTAAEFRSNGYKVHARVLAVPAEDSMLSNYHRRELQHAAGFFSRLTPKATHDAAYAGVLTTIEALEKRGAVDRVEVVTRAAYAKPLYENQLSNTGEWQKAPAAAAVIQAERDRPWTLQRMAAYASGWDSVEKLAAKRLAEVGAPAEVRRQELAEIRSERKACEKRVVQRNERAGHEAPDQVRQRERQSDRER